MPFTLSQQKLEASKQVGDPVLLKQPMLKALLTNHWTRVPERVRKKLHSQQNAEQAGRKLVRDTFSAMWTYDLTASHVCFMVNNRDFYLVLLEGAADKTGIGALKFTNTAGKPAKVAPKPKSNPEPTSDNLMPPAPDFDPLGGMMEAMPPDPMPDLGALDDPLSGIMETAVDSDLGEDEGAPDDFDMLGMLDDELGGLDDLMTLAEPQNVDEAKQAINEAIDAFNVNMEELKAALIADGDPDLKKIGESGLTGMGKAFLVPLRVSMLDNNARKLAGAGTTLQAFRKSPKGALIDQFCDLARLQGAIATLHTFLTQS